jgi:hypothetical protein
MPLGLGEVGGAGDDDAKGPGDFKRLARRRNQTIRNKFFQEKPQIQASHPHIVEWFDSAGGRDTQTDIIENCFKKSNAVWKLDLDKPFFKESKTRCVSNMEAHIEL